MSNVIRGQQHALATFLGWDINDLRENRYQYGRTGSLAVFVVGDSYMMALKLGSSLPKHKEYGFAWCLVQSNFFGWDIYEFVPFH